VDSQFDQWFSVFQWFSGNEPPLQLRNPGSTLGGIDARGFFSFLSVSVENLPQTRIQLPNPGSEGASLRSPPNRHALTTKSQ
jgi:hypothetical protein